MLTRITPINLLKSNLLGLKTLGIRSISLKPDFSKLKKIEQPPGYIVGTVNDAYKYPMMNHYEGSYHWAYERAISIALIPLALTPFFGIEHPLLDTTFCMALMFHCHSGIKSCIIDYIPKRVYGVWHNVASGLLTAGSFFGIYGIYVLETANNGIFDLLGHLWGA